MVGKHRDTYLYTHMDTNTHVRARTHEHAQTHTYISTHTYSTCTDTQMYIHMSHTLIHAHTHMYIHKPSTYTHTCMRTHIHSHTCTNTHTCMNMGPQPPRHPRPLLPLLPLKLCYQGPLFTPLDQCEQSVCYSLRLLVFQYLSIVNIEARVLCSLVFNSAFISLWVFVCSRLVKALGLKFLGGNNKEVKCVILLFLLGLTRL